MPHGQRVRAEALRANEVARFARPAVAIRLDATTPSPPQDHRDDDERDDRQSAHYRPDDWPDRRRALDCRSCRDRAWSSRSRRRDEGRSEAAKSALLRRRGAPGELVGIELLQHDRVDVDMRADWRAIRVVGDLIDELGPSEMSARSMYEAATGPARSAEKRPAGTSCLPTVPLRRCASQREKPDEHARGADVVQVDRREAGAGRECRNPLDRRDCMISTDGKRDAYHR